MAVDSFSYPSEDVLQDLDPLSRALLDLSLDRGMEDSEIADVLGTDEDSVLEVRVGLMRALADKVAPEHADAEIPELQAVVADRLYGDKDAEAQEIAELEAAVPATEADEQTEAEPQLATDPEPAADEPVAPQPTAVATAEEPRKRRSPLVFLLPLLLVIALAGVIVLLTSGGGNEDEATEPVAQKSAAPAEPQVKPEPKGAAQPKPAAVRMTALGGNARGTASLDGNRLTLKLSGLPVGAHEVWLYDSIIDAKSLGSGKSSKLPADAQSYEFIDVSVEPADGNANHSGQSVLRVPLKQLAR